MSTSYITYPPKGVPIYANVSLLPSTAIPGSLATVTNTDSLYIYDAITGWVLISAGGGGGISGAGASSQVAFFTGTSVIASSSTLTLFGGILTTPNLVANGRLGVNISNPGAQLEVDIAGAAITGMIIKGAASQSSDLQQWQSSAGAVLGSIASDGTPSFPGAGVRSQRIGATSIASATDSIAIGVGATASAVGSQAWGTNAIASGGGAIALGDGAAATFSSSIAIGSSTSVSGNGAIAIGDGGSTAAAGAVALGNGTQALATDSIAIGNSAIANNIGSIVIGRDTTDTAAHQFVAGSDTRSINNVYFGRGVSSATPSSYAINGTGGLGTDIAGGDLNLAGGASTGAGLGGSIGFFTSLAGSTGSTTNGESQRMLIDQAGLVSIGSGSQFQVNSTGNLIKIRNVSYSWPAAQGAVSTVLTDDGSGNLSWSTVSGGANVSLSNLSAPTAVNQNLNFSVDGSFDIGSPDGGTTVLRPNTIYAKTAVRIGRQDVVTGGDRLTLIVPGGGGSGSLIAWGSNGDGPGPAWFNGRTTAALSDFVIAYGSSGNMAGPDGIASFQTTGSFTLKRPSGANILWTTDGAGTIGGNTVNRPSDIYVSNTINSGGNALFGPNTAERVYLVASQGVGTRIVIGNTGDGGASGWRIERVAAAASDLNFAWGTGAIGTNTLVSLQTSGSLTMNSASGANILWATDGAGSIGAAGASRPLNIDAAGTITGAVSVRSVQLSTREAGAGADSSGGGTLVAGTVTITTSAAKTTSRIFVTDTTTGALVNVGSLVVSAKNIGNFTVKSTNSLDTSTFDWLIINPY